MERKKTFVVKELNDETCSFKGYLSTYENTDRTGDIIERGAFKESISKKAKVPMLKNHDHNVILGHMLLEETEKGVLATGVFNKEIPAAMEMYSHLKHGDIDAMSVGMRLLDYEEVNPKEWFSPLIIKQAEVLEGSVVTVPANAEAEILEVKSQKEKTKTLEQFKLESQELVKEILRRTV